MLRKNRSRKEKVIVRTVAAILATALVQSGEALAQSTDSADDAALVAAERALLEGLSAKGPSAFEQPEVSNPAAPQAELKPAAYQAPVIKQEQIRDEAPAERAKGAAPIAQENAAKKVAKAPLVEKDVELPVVQAPSVPNPNAGLKRELEASQKRISDLERQLEEVRGQLTMAETELSRLATISEARNRASLGRSALPSHIQASGASAPVVAKARLEVPAPTRMEVPAIEPTPASSADLTIATVEVDKAELRLGPGKNHSALMTVAKGSRLAVEARQGEWLRVFAPNGQRAWVQSRLVTFGAKGNAKSVTSTVRVHGYSSSIEDEAFKRVQSLTAGR
jgi:hypothetical protein